MSKNIRNKIMHPQDRIDGVLKEINAFLAFLPAFTNETWRAERQANRRTVSNEAMIRVTHFQRKL